MLYKIMENLFGIETTIDFNETNYFNIILYQIMIRYMYSSVMC